MDFIPNFITTLLFVCICSFIISVSECSEEELKCLDGQCIPRIDFCDGKFDCTDKTDEPNGCVIDQSVHI